MDLQDRKKRSREINQCFGPHNLPKRVSMHTFWGRDKPAMQDSVLEILFFSDYLELNVKNKLCVCVFCLFARLVFPE